MPPSTPAPPLSMRPSLEYQHAFDLCAVEVRREGGAVAVFASSPFYARELLKRLNGCETGLVPIGGWRASAGDIGELLAPELEQTNVETSERLNVRTKTALWAEPEMEDGQQVLEHIAQVLLPGGKLYVIASGWLARFLPEWKQVDRRPSERPAALWPTVKWLRQAGFKVKALWGFHGPWSILCGFASRWLAHLGRSDWADRCHFHMRAQYIVRGPQALLAPVGVAVARRK